MSLRKRGIGVPAITVQNRQRRQRLSIARLHAFALAALRQCLLVARRGSELPQLHEVSVIVVSDLQIAKIHRQFMDVPGPTDVITFHHGEIFVSADTAAANARRLRTSLASELRLYLLHGLLHLAGFEDKSISAARSMRRMESTILAQLRLSCG